MEMEFESRYEINRTVEFIISKSFTRIALQFPDELLKESTKVVRALKSKLKEMNAENGRDVRFFVMADTTYGSCCVDEVGALHIDSQCVVHYGQTCLSSTSVLPAFFVFGKASINVASCVKHLLDYMSKSNKPVLILYGLGLSKPESKSIKITGYLHMIHHMQALISAAGKKSYILAMGRPNPAKLANFPECDVFIYISCAQTALLDSKEFMAPVITPFEANLAFSRGSEWTGAYLMHFQDVIINSSKPEAEAENGSEEEPRFSFFQGGYVEDHNTNDEPENGEEETMALVQAAEKALQLRGKDHNQLAKQTAAKSGPEYFLNRAYRGLEINSDNTTPEPFLVGRSGKASGYKHE